MQRTIFFSLILAMMISCPASAEQKNPVAPAGNAKCPVCGMFVAKYRDWLSSITFGDGATVYFDGPKDLLKFHLNPGKYGSSKKQGDIHKVQVKDYYSLALIDGRQSYFVLDSDVLGPMGRELVPFSKKEDAEGFLKDHHGKRVLRFGEITPVILKSLE